MGPRAAYECYGASSGCTVRGAHRRPCSGLSHTRSWAEDTGPLVKIKTHKVCSFVVFQHQVSHKNEVGVETEGLQGRVPWQGTPLGTGVLH